jgi:hypothetical protein
MTKDFSRFVIFLALLLIGGLTRPAHAMLHPGLGRFMQEEPLGADYIDGFDLYWADHSNSILFVDPTGLDGGIVSNPIRTPVTTPGPAPTPPTGPTPRPMPSQIVGGAVAIVMWGGVADVYAEYITDIATDSLIIEEAEAEAAARYKADPLPRRFPWPRKKDCPDCKDHHVMTNKNDIDDSKGGPYTPEFENRLKDFFGAYRNKQGEFDLDKIPENHCEVCDIGDGRIHSGPRSEEYHKEVLRRLDDILTKYNDRKTKKLDPGSLRTIIRNMLNKFCLELNTENNRWRNEITKEK